MWCILRSKYLNSELRGYSSRRQRRDKLPDYQSHFLLPPHFGTDNKTGPKIIKDNAIGCCILSSFIIIKSVQDYLVREYAFAERMHDG